MNHVFELPNGKEVEVKEFLYKHVREFFFDKPLSAKAEFLDSFIVTENLNVLDFQLKPSEMNSLNGMDIGRRFNDPGESTQRFGCFCPIYD